MNMNAEEVIVKPEEQSIIEPDQEFTTDFNSPTSATDDGQPIAGLI